MVRPTSIATSAFLFLLCTALPARAQERVQSEGSAPAHVSFVEGAVTLEREGRIEDAPANMPLLAGDRLRTRAGRVEVLFGDGSTLHLDQDSTLDLQSDELVRLIGGRLRLSIPGPSREIAYRVDTTSGWAQISDAGEYRATLKENEFELAVLRGRAELVNEDGRTSLRAGERAFARTNAAPSYAYVFNSASWDAFDRWSEGRRSERLGLSSQYLPEEVRAYSASFDRNGSWSYDASYGYVWYPRVDVGWRPYYYGRWVPYRHYGVSWVSAHAWGWPTHHYGRWGFNSGVWFWIPGRTWGPSWVSWAYAPGYVSWCPLGWNNRAVVQFGYYPGHHGSDHWRAWTVVPYRTFGSSYVHRTVVTSNRIDARTRGAFVQRDRAPDVVGYAVPRGSVGAAPIRVAGTAASRSTASPLLSNRGAGDRALPSRSVVRSSRSVTADSPAQTDSREVTRAVPRTQDRPVYQPENRAVERSRPRSAESPVRPADSISSPLSSDPGRSSDLPTYRREDGYRARPESSTPTDRYAVPRGDFRRPAVSEPRRGESNRPSYGAPAPYAAPPSYGPSRPAAPPPAAGGSDRGSARPAEGSRPSGGAPSRGTAVARPRGGG